MFDGPPTAGRAFPPPPASPTYAGPVIRDEAADPGVAAEYRPRTAPLSNNPIQPIATACKGLSLAQPFGPGGDPPAPDSESSRCRWTWTMGPSTRPRRMLTRRRVSMNHYAILARNHWRTQLPTRYAALAEPEAGGQLGAQAMEEIDTLASALEGPDQVETFWPRRGGCTQRAEAGSIVLRELILLPGLLPTPEDEAGQPAARVDQTPPVDPSPVPVRWRPRSRADLGPTGYGRIPGQPRNAAHRAPGRS